MLMEKITKEYEQQPQIILGEYLLVDLLVLTGGSRSL
jgi:hypothetical protein